MAHQVGDIHPKHSDLVWTEYKPGKFDWRGVKKSSSVKTETAKETKVVEEPEAVKLVLTKPQQEMYDRLLSGKLVKIVYRGQQQEFQWADGCGVVNYRAFTNLISKVANFEGKDFSEVYHLYLLESDFDRFEEVMSEVNYTKFKAAFSRNGKFLLNKQEFLQSMKDQWEKLTDDQKDKLIENIRIKFGFYVKSTNFKVK